MTQERYELLVKHCNDLLTQSCSESPKRYSIGCPQNHERGEVEYTIECPFYHQACAMNKEAYRCWTEHSHILAKRWLKKMTVIQEILS